jgi:hypothetical protein
LCGLHFLCWVTPSFESMKPWLYINITCRLFLQDNHWDIDYS